MSTKQQKEQVEKDKKIRKKRALMLEPKESNANKFKYLQSLIEEDSDIVSFCKVNHSITGLVLSEYTTGQVLHCKKGKQSAKIAMSHLKLVEFAGKVFPYNEFHVFESLFTLLENYLSLGTDPTLRRAAYDTLLTVFEFKNEYNSQFARLLLSTMNIGSLIDLPPNAPFPALVNEPFVPTPIGVSVVEKELAMEFIDKFLEKLLKKETYKTFLCIAEHICALLLPSFSKTITLSCVIPPGGLSEVPIGLMEIVLTELRKLIGSEVKTLFFAENGAVPFLEYILSTALNFSPEKYKNGLNYFTFFFTQFVAKTDTAAAFEEALGPERLLEFRRFVVQCADIPFERAEMNPMIQDFTAALHVEMMELLRHDLDLMDDMKDLLIATLVNNINKLLVCYRDDAVGSLADTIIMLYVKWRHSATAYSKLYDMLHQFYSSVGLLKQLCQKYVHVTLDLITPKQVDQGANNNPTVRYKTTEAVYVFPKKDPTFSDMLTFKSVELFELWEGLWFMLQETCVEPGVKDVVGTIRLVGELLIKFNPTFKVNLMDVFGTYYLRALSSVEDPAIRCIAGLGLCDLFVNDKRYVIEAYSTFYESVVPLIPEDPYAFLLALKDVFSLRMPGCTRLIVPMISMLQQLRVVPEKSHENVPTKIIGLLNSMLYCEKMFPSVLQIMQFEETLGPFPDAFFAAQKHLMTLFQDETSQDTLLWSMACHLHLLVVEKNNTQLPLDILKCILAYLPTGRYQTVCQIISSFSRLKPVLPVPLLRELHSTAFQSIPSLSNQTSGCLIFAMLEYLLSPEISPVVHSLEIGPQIVEGLASALHMDSTHNGLYKAVAPEAAEAYLGTYFSALGTEAAMMVNSPGDDITETTMWFCNGNTIYSLSHPHESDVVTITVRNSVGRFVFTFDEAQVTGWSKTVEKLEILGKVTEGNGVVPEKIYTDVNDISKLIDSTPEELIWDFPTEIKKREDFFGNLKMVTDECVSMRKQLEAIPKQKIEIMPPRVVEKMPIGIIEPIKTGMLMTELFFIDALAISSGLTSLPSHEKFRASIIGLDKTPSRRTHGLSIVYVRRGDDKNMVLKEEEASKRYINFSRGIGEEIEMSKFNGYCGNLERNGSEGSTVLYFKSSTREAIYYEMLRIPTNGNEEKKIKVLDENVVTVWDENGEETQFKDEVKGARIVVKPGMCGVDAIEIYRKKDVRVFGPLLDNMIVPEDLLPQLVRETDFNADDCVNQRTVGDNILFPFLKRKGIIEEIIPKNPTFSQKGYLSTINVLLDDKELRDAK